MLRSPRTEVHLLLDRVVNEPHSVSQRARVLLEEIDAGPDDNAEVLALLQRCYGLGVRGGGDTSNALIWLQKSVDSAAAGGLYSLAASSQLALASTLSMAGDFVTALRSVEAALPLLPSNEVASALSRRALFLQRLERNADAVVAYDEAVERAASDNQTLDLAKTLNNRGLFRVEQGEMKSAASDLFESSRHFLNLGLVGTSASIDHNLGWCFARQGLVVEALNAYERSDAKGGLGSSATWEGAFDRAEVYVSARLLTEALHSAKHAYRLAREAGFESEVPVISLQLGRIHAALGDVQSAKESFALAEARFHDQGRRSSAEAAHVCCLLVSDDSQSGLNSVSLFDDLDPHGYRDTLVDVAYGELLRLRLQSQPGKQTKRLWLENLLENGLASTSSLSRLQACAARLVMLGLHNNLEDDFRVQLVEAAEKLFMELEQHLEGIHSQELRTVVVDKLELEALFCDAALSISDPAMFELWIGRLRAAVSSLPRFNQPSDQPSDQPSNQASDQAGNQHDRLRSSSIEPVDLKNLRESSIGPQRNALEFAVRSTHWTTRATSPVDTVQSDLSRSAVVANKGQVILVYAQDSTNVVVSVVTEHSASIEIMGSLREIRTRSESVCLGAAALFGTNIRGSERGEQRAVSVVRAIDRLETLVLPVTLPEGDLLISTTGCLGGVPWSLFPRLAGRSITLTSSLFRAAATDNTRQAGPNQARVGIVEGPELDYASGEVDALLRLYANPIVLRGSDATVEAVCDLLTSADVVHVAAHGRRRVDNALFSGIDLFDGPLMAYDIERLSQTPRTVILSCCDLGAANSQGAFGLLGFSGALVSRGTLQVAAAVLPVSDEMSRSVMVRLHEAMHRGLSVSQAVAHGVANANSLFEQVTAGSYVVKGP